MKKSFASVTTLLLLVLVISISGFGQNPATSGTANGKYGLQSWAIDNQRIASMFNYDINSEFQSGLGTFSFPAQVVQNALCFGSARCLNPFNTNASVNIVDQTSSNSEVVALNSAPSCSGAGGSAICTLSLANANTHLSYHLRSGTCGLREAINDLGLNGGTIIVDQKFYDDNCSAATITAQTLAAFSGVRQNIYIHDISNGVDQWYLLKPTNNTVIATPAALVPVAASGSMVGTNWFVEAQYVDCVGGQGLVGSSEAQPGGTPTGLSVPSPAASTGACGWIPMIPAAGNNGSGNEISVCNTAAACAAVCTQSTTETVTPACAIGATATITTNPSATAKPNIEAWGHTAFAYLPVNGVPSIAFNGGSLGASQFDFLPFVAGATLSSSNQDLAQWYTEPGYFNGAIAKTWAIPFKATLATQVASSVQQWTLTAANEYGQTIRTLCTVLMPTQTAAGISSVEGTFNIKVAAVGSSGTFWCSTPGGIISTIGSTGASVSAGNSSSAVSGTLDLTKRIFWQINLAETAGHNITSPTVQNVNLVPLASN